MEVKPLPIAENLSNALRHLRPPQQGFDSTQAPLRICIDAICINQSDVKERNAQVSVMQTIYSNASLVRIWIYEPNLDASSEQVKRLQQFDELLDATETKESRRSVMASLTYWQPVLPIFENPYWHRVWMQQEVLNAQMLKLHCMDIVVSHIALVRFQAFSTALQIVRSNKLEHNVKANSSHYGKRLAPAMNISNSKNTLMKLLERKAILEQRIVGTSYKS